MKFRRFILILVIFSLLVPASVHAQTPTPPPEVQAILDSMTPEERVGQLFLVSFMGTDTSANSQIYNLINTYHVGGVVLLSKNDNFVSAPDTAIQTHTLIKSLHDINWEVSVNPAPDITGKIVPSVYVPLFVGIAQEGNGYPTDQLLNGLTPLPSEMAIGATWSTELATRVGQVRGQELAALGFNFYIGPSLDVLASPTTSGGDLGTRVFGGDPYWVGEMGRAYVSGLHLGSDNHLLVIAKHFPGVGGSDRLPEEEVSTVRKSLEQLKQIELAPFFAVTGNALSPESTADGLLVSHIRYQGFQGNIRATTRPVSFDSQALAQILDLPQFSTWRTNGGLIVSDDLGTKSVRDFYVQGGDKFSARNVARDAFLAGNDMLYLGNILSDDAVDTYSTTERILDFFAQKYKEDPAFAQRVDASVIRILSVKLKLYGSFVPSNVIAPSSGLDVLGTSASVNFDVARNAATLISPTLQDLQTVLPAPPQVNDQMVFLTDTVNTKQCSTCPEQPGLAVDALQQAALQLYGPQSGNLTANFRLSSYSLQNLQSMLDGLKPPFIEEDISKAAWIVISVTDASQGQPALIRRFITERSDLLRDKRVIVFSFDAPYYFDATDISKFTAYFALYSKQPQFVDVAARLLFQELPPVGASPVSISGIGYDMINVMAPDPNQIIPLFLDLAPDPAQAGASNTPEPTAIPLFRIGDTIAIRTGVIKDNNGHPVPDGTVVRFSILLTGEGGGILKQVDVVTTQGIARSSFGLDKPGLLEIQVSSEPAVVSEVLQLDVSQTGSVAVTVVVPELTQSVEPTPEAAPVEQAEGYVSSTGVPSFSAWLMAMIFILLGVWIGYSAGLRLTSQRTALRLALGISLGGLAAYNYLVFGLFGISNWLSSSGFAGLMLFIFLGELVGLAGGWIWSRR
ncbi:MAG: glycoside hydrolase family 3 N-terminal domain-containing protein [Anaerolineales bacterium]